MNDLRYIFEYELSENKIPFKDIFRKELFKEYLFKEFCHAEKIPCEWLYRSQYISDDEMKTGLKKDEEGFRKKYQKINDQFYDKQISKTLEKNYYCPNIKLTKIISTLSKIEECYSFFKQCVNSNEDPNLYIEIIKATLKNISHKDLSKEIIKELIADKNNSFIFFDNDDNYQESNTKWKKMKLKFDHLIQDHNLFDDEDTNTIIKPVHCLQLFEKHKDTFPSETEHSWINRFKDGFETLQPLIYGNHIAEITGILAAVHEENASNNPKVFNDYVIKRWGIKNFSRKKGDHGYKDGYKHAFKSTSDILSGKR